MIVLMSHKTVDSLLPGQIKGTQLENCRGAPSGACGWARCGSMSGMWEKRAEGGFLAV